MNARRPILASALGVAVAAALAAAPRPAPAQTAKKLDGKQIFLAQKCETCHAVSTAQIKATGKIKAPDLAGMAAKQDAAWLGKYLRKQDKNKAGKLHVKAFTGSDEEMGALVAWLQSQKAPAKTSAR
ncbi:MAG TPA: cytochrome c [Vicinamibacteria bacterium]|nr:cytochrome c [Vicinamibacteria bacterium]